MLIGRKMMIAAIVFSILALGGCNGTASDAGGSSASSKSGKFSEYGIMLSSFDESAAAGENNVLIDSSNANNGYIGVKAVNDSKLKLQIVFGDTKMNYDLDNTGAPLIVNMQSGNGTYTLRVMQNTVDDKYIEIYSTSVDVTLNNELYPFLYSSTMVSFTKDSNCTAIATKLRNESSDEIEAVKKIYSYIKDNVDYDYAFAESNPKAYVADPDETLSKGTGICFDYATLAAAMLRSQGIPTKLITGYVGEDSVYHAWNLFYTEEGGWVTVNIDAPADEWSRIDITYDSTGTYDPKDTYTDRYVY